MLNVGRLHAYAPDHLRQYGAAPKSFLTAKHKCS